MMRQWIQLVIVFGVCWLQIGSAYGAATDVATGHGFQGIVLECIGIAIVAAVFIYTVKCFLWPGEKAAQHIKRRILRDDW